MSEEQQKLNLSLPIENHLPFLPEFSGKDYEDPEKYLERCNEYLVAHKIPQSYRTRTIEKGLKEEAGKWWASYGPMEVDWPLFQKLIRKQFDNQIIKSMLATTLFGEYQEDDEPTGPFLLQKYSLFQRVRPNESEASIVSTLMHLLKESVKEIVWRYGIVKFSDLLDKALEAEVEVERIKRRISLRVKTVAQINRQFDSSEYENDDEENNEYSAYLISLEFQNATPLNAMSKLMGLQRNCNDRRITHVWRTYADMIKELMDNGALSNLRFLKRNASSLAKFEAALEVINIGRKHSLF